MPPRSATDNVRKICGCTKWKTCSHPWYLWAQRDGVRYRQNLDKLLGRHVADYQQATNEAARALIAKLDGRDPRGLLPEDDPTLDDVLTAYDKERPRKDRWQLTHLLGFEMACPDGRCRPFGEWRAKTITTDTIQQFKALRPLVAGNRDLNLLRAAFKWAVLHGLIPHSPFRIGDEPAIRLGRESARTRRLHPDEDERLLGAATSLLRDLIVAALETGMRRGELLSLQWHQVRFAPRAELFLPAEKTKTKRDRRVPISTVLQRVLDARRNDPAGNPLPPDAYVFGTEIGGRLKFPVRPWRRAVLRAHGHRPTYKKRMKGTGKEARCVGSAQLTPASQAALREVNLHFHDLRREAGSRWMDAGIPLATIQRWLGHANIAQTSTYLGASLGGDEQDMRAFEMKVGRVAALPVIASPDSSNVFSEGSTEPDPSQNGPKNAVVH